jgi:outer membrane lipoprotein-sorting protein
MMTPSSPRVAPLARRATALAGLMAAGLFWGAAEPALAQDRALETLEAASGRYAGFTTVCADFHQVLTVTLLGTRNESRGELCQRRPNLFFMRFSEPRGDEIVADGTWFWVYYASLNPEQAVKLPLDPSRGGLDFYREFLESPDERYHVTLEGEEEVTGRATIRILVRPRAPRGYREARVWIDPAEGMIRRVEVAEDNGTVRRITLDQIRVDPPVEARAFTFQVPDGVRIITR